MRQRILIALVAFFPMFLLIIGINVFQLDAAPSATILVDTLIDENDGSCADGDCSLRDAINTAVNNDLIVFDNGLSGGVIDISPLGQLDIDKNITISGTVPITITGNNSVRVFDLGASIQVELISLTIADGNAALLDCTIIGPPSSCGGGMRISLNSDVTVRDVLFFNNSSETGGAILISSSQLNVINSTFMSNTAMSGGGIFVDGTGNVVVNGSTFIGNSTTGNGGAINNGNADPLIIKNSLFANNSGNYGGALYGAAFTEISVEDSTLRDNIAAYGGAIHVGNSDSYLTILNSTLNGNIATNGGGAVSSGVSGKLTIVNSTISGNMAVGSDMGSDGGGGIFLNWFGGIYAITNTTIVSNSAPNVIGRDGLWLFEGTLKIRNSIIAHNHTSNCTWDSGLFDGDSSNISNDNSCSGFLVGDPLLDPLADNGGWTLTHSLQPGSPAIDSGNNLICPPTDQRGVPRPADGDGDSNYDCDIGAYEFVNNSELNFLSAIFKP